MNEETRNDLNILTALLHTGNHLERHELERAIELTKKLHVSLKDRGC